MSDFSNFTPCPKPEKKVKEKKGLRQKARKPTGEKDLFLSLWSLRPHYSEVSGEYLGEEPNVWFFAHLLGKKAFPRFRLNPDNICLMSMDEHYEYDNGSPEGSNWDRIFAKVEELKIKYHLPQPTI